MLLLHATCNYHSLCVCLGQVHVYVLDDTFQLFRRLAAVNFNV